MTWTISRSSFEFKIRFRTLRERIFCYTMLMKKPKSISISIITLFPKFTDHYTTFGIIARAIANKLLVWRSVDLRQFGLDARQTVDDRPYGGGVGMVLRPDVLYAALRSTESRIKNQESRKILLTPSGKRFTQKDAVRLAKYKHIIFVSGRYEGYDERITKFVDEELSIGDYVLMGGELPALVISEAVLRNVPGVLGKDESAVGESFSPVVRNIDGRHNRALLEYPQYTKPEVWEVKSRIKNSTVAKAMTDKQESKTKKLRVPKVLLTGHHANVKAWREEEALKRTKKHRPDLLIDQN